MDRLSTLTVEMGIPGTPWESGIATLSEPGKSPARLYFNFRPDPASDLSANLRKATLAILAQHKLEAVQPDPISPIIMGQECYVMELEVRFLPF